MATQAFSDILSPGGVVLGGAPTSGGSGDSRILLGNTMKPMKELWPAVDPTNGPMLSDTGMVRGAPTTTDLQLYGWQAGVFNTQSQNWVTAPVGTYQNNSGLSACWNASTPRTTSWGANINQPQESNLDTGWVTDATTVTIVYMHYTYYETREYHDMQVYIEHDGRMKKTTPMPKTGTGSNGLTYRTFTFAEAREREWRILLPWNCHFIGVYINVNASIRKAPNKFLIATNGDSWNEPSGNVLATPIGGAYPLGTFQNFGLSQAIIEATGWAVILIAMGGTGYFNVNSAARSEEYVLNPGGGNVFFSALRMNDFAAKFGGRYPLLWTIGGWNDGSLPPDPIRTSYAARVTSGINRAISAVELATAGDVDLQLMFSGIQPVSVTVGSDRYLSNLGIQDAMASAPDNVIGYIDEMDMWQDNTMAATAQRRANVNSSDTIHLHGKGADMVSNWHLATAKKFSIPADYYHGMITTEAA